MSCHRHYQVNECNHAMKNGGLHFRNDKAPLADWAEVLQAQTSVHQMDVVASFFTRCASARSSHRARRIRVC